MRRFWIRLTREYLWRNLRNVSGTPQIIWDAVSEGERDVFTRLRQKFFLEKAAELLLDSSLSVDEAASRLGYQSTSSFFQVVSEGVRRRAWGLPENDGGDPASKCRRNAGIGMPAEKQTWQYRS